MEDDFPQTVWGRPRILPASPDLGPAGLFLFKLQS